MIIEEIEELSLMSSNIKACLLHNSDNWRTPSKLYNYVINYLGCTDTFEYCSSIDQYSIMYEHELLFMNPPFSHLRTDKFLNYIQSLMLNHNTIIMLLPLRCDTKWFKFLSSYISNIYLIHGRLHFNDSKASSPFPCMILRLDLDEAIIHQSYKRHFDNTYLCSIDEFIDHRYQ